MVEFKIDLPDMKKWNLAALYMAARKKYLLPAMQQSVDVTLRAVRGLMPVGATRHMINSMETRVIQGAGSTVGKVTTSIRNDPSIFVMAAGGRLPGKKRPPSQELVEWVRFKGIGEPGQETRTAFVIARSIGRKGTQGGKGRFFMVRGLESSRPPILKFFGRAVESITQELDHGN